MGRPKGYKPSQEELDKRKETRLRNKHKVETKKPTGKIALLVTGTEKTGFDYWNIIRSTLRPMHLYMLCSKIEKEIVNPKIWDDKIEIKKILEKYFIIQKGSKVVYNKKKREISEKTRQDRRDRMIEYHKNKKSK